MPRFLVATLALAAFVAAPGLSFAQTTDPWIGKWRLNLARSTYSPATLAPKSQTLTQEAVPGGGFRAVNELVDAQGQSVRQETMATFDGKPSEVRGAPDANTLRVYKRLDPRSYEYVQTVGGKVTTTVRTVVSPDGKERTITTTGTNAQGQKVNIVAVYERM